MTPTPPPVRPPGAVVYFPVAFNGGTRMAQLHGVELPGWVHTNFADSIWLMLPDGTRVGARISPGCHDSAAAVRQVVKGLEVSLARRGLEGVGREIVPKDPRLVPPAARQKLGA